MEGLLVPITLFVAIAAVLLVYILSQARTRRLLIERGMMDDRYSHVLAAEARMRTFAALKWGLVLAGFALGLIVVGLARLDEDNIATWGTPLLGAALGFLAYYRVARHETFAPASAPRPAPLEPPAV